MHRKLSKLLFAVLIILIAAPAHAETGDDDRFPYDSYCQTRGASRNNFAFGGKPVFLLTGMETHVPSPDLSLGSNYPIAVTRSYNSQTSYDSPLGYGWAINYDKRLYTYRDNSVTIRRKCGGKMRFQWIGPGYIGTTPDSGILIHNAGDGSFTYTDNNGETEKYDAQGRLISASDTKGNSLVFTYESPAKAFLWGLLPANLNQVTTNIVAYDYRLSRIAEQDAAGGLTGKAVDLHYDLSTGRLTDIVDSLGRTVFYTHDSIGNLLSVTGPNGNIVNAYNDANNNHLLTGIDEGGGGYANTYDTTGRVTRQVHGTGVIDFEYTDQYKKTKMTTTVKDSAGAVLNTQVRTVEFDQNGMTTRMTDAYGNVTAYVRDSNTWVLQESTADAATGATTTTAYAYDGKGNTLARTEAQGTPIEKTTGILRGRSKTAVQFNLMHPFTT